MNSPHKEIIKLILDAIRKNDAFILFNHANPDGDAIGSQLAFHIALKNQGKRTYMFSSEKVGDEYAFLPYVNEVQTKLPDSGEFEAAIILDSAKSDRISRNGAVDLSKYKVVINIDHHISNTNYGTINLVASDSSSAGELVYLIIKEAGWQINAEIATCLYTAIFTDTGGFRHGNTSAEALRYASELVSAGANPHFVARNVYGSYSDKRYRLLGKSLATLKTAFDGKLAIMWVYTDFHSELGTTLSDADEFVEYPRAIKGVQVCCLFKEMESNSKARANLRSNNSRYDVNKIASKFGGGGHVEAAACDINGTREEIEQSIIDAVREEFGNK